MAYETHANGSWFDESNLVAYYKLENVNDSGPSGFNLTNVGTTTFVAGKFTNCANFVKTSGQYLYVNNNLGIDGGNCTFSFWLYLASSPAAGVYYSLFRQTSATAHASYAVEYYNDSGTLKLYVDRNKEYVAHQAATITRTLPTTTWLHYCYTYNGTAVVFYENGVQIGTVNASGNGTTSTDNYIVLGSFITGAAVDPLNGRLDEFIAESRAWTAGEVAKYYENSKGQFYGQVQ